MLQHPDYESGGRAFESLRARQYFKEARVSGRRQKVLVLYLANSALDAPVIAWARYDGTGETLHMAGDQDEAPYATGVAALQDGWRLFQASQLLPHPRGEEFDLAYLKYEFFFEQLVETP